MDNSLTPTLNYYDDFKATVKFTGSCLQQPKISHTPKKVVNIYIIHELGASGCNINDPTLKNFFTKLSLTKNADIDKYRYSGYGIGFDRKSSFSFPSGRFGQNVLILGVDMKSSAHIDNKKKDILVLRKGPTQGLEHTLTTEKMYWIILLWQERNSIWGCIIKVNSYLFVNGTETYKFKAKDSEIVASPLCLGNISKDCSTDNMKKKINVYVYDFSVDYDATGVDDIKDIHKYLMKRKKNSVNGSS